MTSVKANQILQVESNEGKEKNTLIKKRKYREYLKCPVVHFNMVPVMCLAYRYVALFTFAGSGAAFPGDTGAFATFYTE